MLQSNQQAIEQLRQYINQHILGQESLVLRLLITLLADGHLLVEGVPGLAKTKTIKILAMGLEGSFHRIQFTPDLLPSDLTGSQIYHDGSFTYERGPIFHNLVLADEINRAPAKVQSALLEAMAERQVTIGSKTEHLPELFLVMATQNPIEQEGTYPLPEAQLDRFLMKVRVSYPNAEDEQNILHVVRQETQQQDNFDQSICLSQRHLFEARKEILDLHLSSELEKYLVQLIIATRNPEAYSKKLSSWLQFGASTRATISLDRCARAHAWLKQRDYVSPEDIQIMAYDVLRHRLILSFEAEAEGINTDQCIKELLENVPVP